MIAAMEGESVSAPCDSIRTPTPLPFPSEQFLQFLSDQPQAGKYFALGPRVIAVIDGAAYETVEGEVDAIPDRLDPSELGSQLLPAPATPSS